ncbi:hypothetical protein [Ectothiorhodospira haloalkaliphila]|nr:hypothetical protein [Ectothiorhodospira haloalkaliphila]
MGRSMGLGGLLQDRPASKLVAPETPPFAAEGRSHGGFLDA